MKQVGWALVVLLAISQIAIGLEMMELSSLVKKVQAIEESTATLKNEAAAKALETERIRNTYYRVLMTSPFKLDEEQAKGIIKRGSDETNNQATDKQ